jgi:ABC-type multidrug transport system fused ATPase/permease subunit
LNVENVADDKIHMNEIQQISIFRLINGLWLHISKKRKWQIIAVLTLMLLTAILEILSIGALLPFLSILMSPEGEISNASKLFLYLSNFGFEPKVNSLYSLTLLFIALSMLAGAVRLLLLWSNMKLSFGIGADFSNDIYRKTLYQKYQVHIKRNSSDVISGVMGKTNHVISNVVLPLLTIISSFVIISSLLAFAVLISPLISLVIYGGFFVIYASIILITRKKLYADSIKFSKESSRMVKVLQEALGGIRDIILNSSQQIFCDIYRDTDKKFRAAQLSSQFIGQCPRYIIEALGISLIAATAYYFVDRGDSVTQIVPILAALALSSQRMLPMLQQAYSSWTNIQSGQAALADILDLLNQPLPSYLVGDVSPCINFEHSIQVRNVSFKYLGTDKIVLQNLNFQIDKGDCIGIIGETGCGKSTMVDLLMGLMEPSGGEILIDGELLGNENQHTWMKFISHVPQNIYLCDGTIYENIAFGISKNKINYEKINKAAAQAKILDTIETWPDGFNTIVGENGIRLSGGQRQRIGIARALYKDADLLVFDEATSSLDADTEDDLMRAIDFHFSNLTIIMIAHRISTLKNCNKIFVVSNGTIKKITSYENIKKEYDIPRG